MRVLIIDDDESLVKILKDFVRFFYQAEAIGALSIEDARSAIENFEPDLIILDIILQGYNAAHLIEEFKTLHYNPTIVAMSGMPNIKQQIDEYKPSYFLEKPFDLETLEEIISKKAIDTIEAI